ncbi:aspartic proteinase Asp1 [Canna indica]|uniref:Aspartic proteinase Asp1 n=1 Tax=Canna indica TaxID=4628 RepID=A0AAQ3QJZ1_9LILI|nr:aspartic proteinase Asp1 [Canna indica]
MYGYAMNDPISPEAEDENPRPASSTTSADKKRSTSDSSPESDRKKMAARGLLLVTLLVVAAAVLAIPSVSASSAIFPVFGDVYPLGVYYVAMNIGDPPKPYFLDVDTGSDLSWVQCDAPCIRCSKGPHPWYKPKRLLTDRDPLCVALHSGSAHDQEGDQCDYDIHYKDQGSSLGVLVADAFALRFANSNVFRHVLAFGCGYDQQFAIQNPQSVTDGVLGLGAGKVSILSQLSDQGATKNVIGHCLSGKGGGFLFFGSDFIPSSGMTWMPMSRIASGYDAYIFWLELWILSASKVLTCFFKRNYYSPGIANLYWGTQSLGVNQMEVVLDAGSTFSYFESQPYQAFLSAVKTDLSKKPLEEINDPALPVCWKGPKPFKFLTDVKNYFKPLTLNFVSGNRTLFEIPPEKYLIITKDGHACLGVLNGSGVGLGNINVIGDISLQEIMVVYDNEKQQIGWIRTACERKGQSKYGISSP